MKKLISVFLSVLMLVSLCSVASADEFTGSANGLFGEVNVTLTIEDGQITAAEVTAAAAQEGNNAGQDAINDGSFEPIIVDAQGAEFDAISGVTVTSDAVKAATLSALADAGLAEVDAVSAEDVECDIVIIGAGGAGMSAALQAIDAGVGSVILVETTGSTGGNSSRATGGMNAAKSTLQDANTWADSTTTAVQNTIASAKAALEAGTVPENVADAVAELVATVEAQFDAYLTNPEGYFDSPELFALDTMVGGGYINNIDLVMTLVNNSVPAIDWLETKNASLTSVGSFGGASVMRIHRPLNAEGKTTAVGKYLVNVLTEDVNAVDAIDLRLNTTATELVVTDGAVTGVKVTNEAGEYTITAKAVILTTGGFGADLDRVAFYAPNLKGFVTTNAPGATGSGIDMATAVGAATVDMEQIQIHPSVYTETAALITEGIRGDGAILINQEGNRFIDELQTRNVVSAAELEQTGGYAYTILDQKMMDASATYAGYYNNGYAVKGETIEELAEAIGVDPETFAATMESWNAAIDNGVDPDFGRTSLLVKLDTAPFYAIKVAPGIHHTMGGIAIDTDAQVLNEAGEVIPGLFAAGEVTGGVHGNNRLGGNAVADIVVFGRIAAQSAAEYIK